ncbi:MAG: carboxymuconolactone decarboxylase family protein [Bacteroidota bacterium]
MENLNVPTREEVSENNQKIFDNLKTKLGFVPNLYAAFAHSDTALGDYLAFQNRKSSLKAKEREVINLVVSQVNDCEYCQAAHTVLGKMNGFSSDQVLELRSGSASFDKKLDALAKFTKETTINRGKPSQDTIDNLLAVGYTQESIVDIIIVIGDKIVSNFLHGVGGFEVDFPAAPALEEAVA